MTATHALVCKSPDTDLQLLPQTRHLNLTDVVCWAPRWFTRCARWAPGPAVRTLGARDGGGPAGLAENCKPLGGGGLGAPKILGGVGKRGSKGPHG